MVTTHTSKQDLLAGVHSYLVRLNYDTGPGMLNRKVRRQVDYSQVCRVSEGDWFSDVIGLRVKQEQSMKFNYRSLNYITIVTGYHGYVKGYDSNVITVRNGYCLK